MRALLRRPRRWLPVLVICNLTCSTPWASQEAELKWAHTLGQLPRADHHVDTSAACRDGATGWPGLLDTARQQAALNRAAQAQAQAAQAQYRQSWAGAWMPRVDVSAGTSRENQTYNGVESQTPTSSVTLTTTLPLWRAADRAQASAQQSLSEQSRWQARGQQVNVARELSLAYLATAEAAEQHRLAQAQLQLLQAQLHINDRRLQAGLGTVLEQLETRTRIDQVRASLREWRMRAATQQLRIERLTGQVVCVPAGLTQVDLGADERALPKLDEALQHATTHNPKIRDAQAQLDAAQATTRARDAEFWQPTLDALASSSRTRQTQHFEGVSDQQNVSTRAIGVQLNWPLFTGGVQHGRVQEAAALLSRSQALQDDASAEIQTGLRDAYQGLQQALGMLSAQREVEQTAIATHEAVNKAFVAGLRTNQDLLVAQQQIYTARQNMVAARVSALSAHIHILALLDRLDAEHVAALGPLFEAAPMPESTP